MPIMEVVEIDGWKIYELDKPRAGYTHLADFSHDELTAYGKVMERFSTWQHIICERRREYEKAHET